MSETVTTETVTVSADPVVADAQAAEIAAREAESAASQAMLSAATLAATTEAAAAETIATHEERVATLWSKVDQIQTAQTSILSSLSELQATVGRLLTPVALEPEIVPEVIAEIVTPENVEVESPVVETLPAETQRRIRRLL